MLNKAEHKDIYVHIYMYVCIYIYTHAHISAFITIRISKEHSMKLIVDVLELY